MSGERLRQIFDEIEARVTEGRKELDALIPAPTANVVNVKPGDDIGKAIMSLVSTGGVVKALPGVYPLNLRWPERPPNVPGVLVTTDGASFGANRVTQADAPNMAILKSANGLDPAIKALPRSRDLTFVYVGFGPQTPDRTVVDLGGGKVEGPKTPADRASGFLFDRCLFQGDATKGQHRGIQANAKDITITKCAFYDYFEIGRDSQAICGWNGTENLAVIECYIEAGAENLLIGGADSASVEMSPRNVAIAGCHFAKNKRWASMAAVPTTKNLLESKNVRGLHVIGCLFERVWGDPVHGWPSGVAIILKSCNGNENKLGEETWATLEDVIIENCIIRDVGSPFTVVGQNDSGLPSIRGSRVTIRNVLAYNINVGDYKGDGHGFPMFSPPNALTIDHITMIGNSHTFMNTSMGNGALDKANGFSFTNSVGYHGEYGLHNAGGLGVAAIDAAYNQPYMFKGNVLRKDPARTVTIPAGSAVIDAAAWDASFLSSGGLPTVKPGSAIVAAAPTTDGKLPGADVTAILAMMNDPL